MSQPISMPWSAPVFPPPPHSWKGVQVAVFPFTPREGAVERILPPGMASAEGPGLVTVLSYPQSEILHPFNECVVMVPVRVGEATGNYVPYIYVTTDEALIPGREIAGFPKKIAEVEWRRDGDRFHAAVTRWGKRIVVLEGRIDGPLPEEIASAQRGQGIPPSINYKLIPGPGGDIEIEEITSVQIEVCPRDEEMGQAQIQSEPSDLDPVADLVPACGGTLILMVSDNTIPDGKVLRRFDRRAVA